MRKLSSSRSHKFPNVASQIRVAFSKIVSNTRLRFPDELAITPNTSEAADNCFSASSRSRSKRVAFAFSLTSGEPGGGVVALSRFDVADLRRRALTVWPPALERRFIAFPKSAQGIVAGQIHSLEVGNSGSRRNSPDTYRCPLWVKSGHRSTPAQCQLCPRKRTWFSTIVMSALCQKRTLAPNR